MPRFLALLMTWLTALVLMLGVAAGMRAQKPEEKTGEKAGEKKDEKKDEKKPEEKVVQTKHSVKIGGQEIKYTATAGTILLKLEDGTPKASVFYIAYTKDDHVFVSSLDGGKPEQRGEVDNAGQHRTRTRSRIERIRSRHPMPSLARKQQRISTACHWIVRVDCFSAVPTKDAESTSRLNDLDGFFVSVVKIDLNGRWIDIDIKMRCCTRRQSE